MEEDLYDSENKRLCVEINKDTNHLLSEDYFFCHSYRQVGGKVWCSWVETGHFGHISLMVNTLGTINENGTTNRQIYIK